LLLCQRNLREEGLLVLISTNVFFIAASSVSATRRQVVNLKLASSRVARISFMCAAMSCSIIDV
jgi:hypothetical protein